MAGDGRLKNRNGLIGESSSHLARSDRAQDRSVRCSWRRGVVAVRSEVTRGNGEKATRDGRGSVGNAFSRLLRGGVGTPDVWDGCDAKMGARIELSART